jgi:D-alanine--poly(phosphoribitol) ligase subunit 1
MQLNVLEYLEATAQRHPDRIAVMDGTDRLTFAELRARARSWALQIEQVAGPGVQPVGLLMPKSNGWIVGLLAVLYAGKIYAPLDYRMPAARLSAILERLGPVAILVSGKSRALALSAGMPEDRILDLGNAPPVQHGEPVGWRSVLDIDPAYIIHTSGSTGLPKGVVISHRSIIDFTDWAREQYCMDGREIIGNQAPYYFDNSTLDFYLSFATGATLVLIPDELFAFPVKLLQFMAHHLVSYIFWVPSVMVNIANLKLLEQPEVPPLTKILFAGEVMPNRQLNQWRRAYPDALFSNLYGPTEITVDCTYFVVNRPFADNEPLPIGFPCRNAEVMILDGNRLVRDPGQIGELCVRGTLVALGYWKDPEKTAEKFVQNPLHSAYPDRIYRTGDLVSYNERGEILFHGRADSQVKHQGFRIELGEIEHACLAVPGLRNACVLYQQERKEITLFFVAAPAVDAAFIRRELAKTLPKYMFPAVFHRLDAMPFNSSGKIDRKTLADGLDNGSFPVAT